MSDAISARYETVVGLEAHVQLSTATKLFCGCPNRFGAPANSQTCPVCLGLPGVLPVLNERALEWGIRVALSVDCSIAPVMKFDRKQYFYPDLPKNYQISQYDKPLAFDGHLEITVNDAPRRIAIRRIHLEEDAGKLLHEASPTDSYVDFNRAGVPLLEIVSEPDIRSADEAFQYLVELKAIIGYLGVSTCNMEEGSLRCDTNISLRLAGAKELGSKVEVKNLNSFRNVKLALEYEIQRQTALLDQRQRIPQETRLWDARRTQTSSMRSKEEAADYRYFPEPDLVPFHIRPEDIERVRKELPELPLARRARYQDSYGLTPYAAQVLTQHQALGQLFEDTLRSGGEPNPVANWIMGEFLAYLNARGLEPEMVKIRPDQLADLLRLIRENVLNAKTAKEVFIQMLEQGKDPAQMVRESGLQQIVDKGALDQIAQEVIQANPKSVQDYLGGKETAFTHLMGQAMKLTRGKANPQQMSQMLKEKLMVQQS